MAKRKKKTASEIEEIEKELLGTDDAQEDPGTDGAPEDPGFIFYKVAVREVSFRSGLFKLTEDQYNARKHFCLKQTDEEGVYEVTGGVATFKQGEIIGSAQKLEPGKFEVV